MDYSNRGIAEIVNNLSDYDFYDVFVGLMIMNDCDEIDRFCNWLGKVLHEIEDNINREEENEENDICSTTETPL